MSWQDFSIADYENKAVREWRAKQSEKGLDRGRLKFNAENDPAVRKGSRSRSVYSTADDKFIIENYGVLSTREIAEHLSTEERPVNRNKVIGRYNRIKDRMAPPPIVVPKIEELPKRIERAVSCATARCSNIPVKYSSHGLCPQCNSRRLDGEPRRNRTREVTAAVGW